MKNILYFGHKTKYIHTVDTKTSFKGCKIQWYLFNFNFLAPGHQRGLLNIIKTLVFLKKNVNF